MTAEELLLELHDLQPPAEPGWWLLAPAWVAALSLLLGLLLLSWLLLRYRQKNRLLVEARMQLHTIRQAYDRKQDIQKILQALSAWLRQVAMAAFPDEPVANLTGAAWVEFLNHCSDRAVFDHELAQALTDEIYRPETDADAESAIRACETWLGMVQGRLQHRGGQRAAT